LATVVPEVIGHAAGEGQLGDVEVELHPVDALELHGDVVGEDICGTAG
jgi:hypothetical protein